jgi:hypothetical protein
MVTSTHLFVLSPLGTAADMTLVSDSPFLVDADDEVAFGNIVAWNLQFARRVELLKHQRTTVPAYKLLDQYRLVLPVNDNITAASWRLERMNVQ